MKLFVIVITAVALIVESSHAGAFQEMENSPSTDIFAQNCSAKIQTIRKTLSNCVSPIKNFFGFGLFNAPNYYQNCPLKFVQYVVTIKPNITYTVNLYLRAVSTAYDNESRVYFNQLQTFSNKIKELEDDSDVECVANLMALYSPDVIRESYMLCIKQVSKQVSKLSNKMEQELNRLKANCNVTENIDDAIANFTTNLNNGIISLEQCVITANEKYAAAGNQIQLIYCKSTEPEVTSTEINKNTESIVSNSESTEFTCENLVAEKELQINTSIHKFTEEFNQESNVQLKYFNQILNNLEKTLQNTTAGKECIESTFDLYNLIPILYLYIDCTTHVEDFVTSVRANVESDLADYRISCDFDIDQSMNNFGTYLNDSLVQNQQCGNALETLLSMAYDATKIALSDNCTSFSTTSEFQSEPSSSDLTETDPETSQSDSEQSVSDSQPSPCNNLALQNELKTNSTIATLKAKFDQDFEAHLGNVKRTINNLVALMTYSAVDPKCIHTVFDLHNIIPILSSYVDCTTQVRDLFNALVENILSDLAEYTISCDFTIVQQLENFATYLNNSVAENQECGTTINFSLKTAYNAIVVAFGDNCASLTDTVTPVTDQSQSVSKPSSSESQSYEASTEPTAVETESTTESSLSETEISSSLKPQGNIPALYGFLVNLGLTIRPSTGTK